MNALHIFSVLITLTALFGYLNVRLLRLPMSIGLMLFSLIFALSLICAEALGIPIKIYATQAIQSIDFSRVLLEGMLGLLLFAGAIHVNINDLMDQKLEISIFATLGVLASTTIVGTLIFLMAPLFNFSIPFIHCLLFGALISPTDPIAVLGILKSANAPKTLEVKITGESLFNDGIGVVLFLVLLELTHQETGIQAGFIVSLFVKEVGGGLVFGLITGSIAYWLLKHINHYQIEIMITLALVVGGYDLANTLHLSAPIAMVVAGLLIGNHGRQFAMSTKTIAHLDTFWELIDEILNALLFVLIGLEVLVLTFNGQYVLIGLLTVPVALFSRFISIGTPVFFLRRIRTYVPNTIKIMTWGGLRGGISVALALSLPKTPFRELFLTMTYMVVCFSILIQGLTIKKLIKN